MSKKSTLLYIFITFLGAILILFSGFFTSCKSYDDSEDEKSTKNKKILTLTANISPYESDTSRINNSRSAVPSDLKDSTGADFVFAAALYPDTTTPSASDFKAGEFNSTTKTVSFSFIFSNEKRENYNLEIRAYPNGTTDFSTEPLLFGTKTKLVIPANEVNLDAGTIVLLPASSSSKGKVNLSLSIPAGYALICNDSTNFICEEKNIGSNDGKYTFKEKGSSGIDKGNYDVAFLILKNASDENSIVYAWNEIINVYPGMTTNKWNSGTVNAGGEREITEIGIFSTYYVSGTGATWLKTNVSSAIPNGNDSTGDGSVGKPFLSAQKAIDKIKSINDGETAYTIYVDGTVTAPSGSGTVANIAPTGNLTLSIIGVDASNQAILDAKLTTATSNGSVIIANGSGLNLTLNNLKITGGNATGNGGGIYFLYGTLTILGETTISGNATDSSGGGIYISNGSLTMKGGIIGDETKTKSATASSYSNKANNGGGLAASSSTVVLENGVCIAYNYAGMGGGILTNESCSLKIDNSEIKCNATSGGGGGIYLSGGDYDYTLTISNGSKINGNTANSNGGGISVVNGTSRNTVIISSGSIISGNTANGDGGGICNSGWLFKIENAIINSNTSSDGRGNAIYIYNNSNLNISGTAQIDENNDVYLANGNTITIAGNLSASKVARVSLPSDEYISGRTVLEADAADLITNNVDKFILNKSGSTTSLCTDCYIKANGTKGVLAKSFMTGTVGLPNDTYTFTLLLKKDGSSTPATYNPTDEVSAADEFSFSVVRKSESGSVVVIPNNAVYKIAIMQNGVESKIKATSTGTNTVKVAIPAKIATQKAVIDIYMSVTVDGVTYDNTVRVR